MATVQVEADSTDALSGLSLSVAGDDLSKTVLIEVDNTASNTDIEGALVKLVGAVREWMSTRTA